MRKLIIALICGCSFTFLFGQQFTAKQYQEDFDYFWSTIRDNYSYWDKKQTDWNKAKSIYKPKVDTVSTRASFVGIVEQAFYEIYDHHASLNTNTSESQRLVPSGADLWAEYANGKPTIVEVKRGSGADNAGM